MAKLSKPPIPLKMYKHFAVVTLMLTASIAMFANSDNRTAMAQHIDERQRETQLREASAARFGGGEIIRRDDGREGGFGSDSESYGQPTLVTQTNGGSRRARRPAGSRQAVPGYPADYIASLSESQYRALVASLPEDESLGSGSADQPDRAAIEAASARRAGRGGTGADAPG